MASRMVPVWQVFDRFPRARARCGAIVGKQVEFVDRGQGDRARPLDARRDRRSDRAPAAQRDRSRHRDARRARRAQGKPAAGRLDAERGARPLGRRHQASATTAAASTARRVLRRAQERDGLVDAEQDGAHRRRAVPAARAAGLLDGGEGDGSLGPRRRESMRCTTAFARSAARWTCASVHGQGHDGDAAAAAHAGHRARRCWRASATRRTRSR